MDTKKNEPRMKGHIGVWRLASGVWRLAFGVRRVGVSAIRGALPRLRGHGGGGAWADWRPEGTE